MARIKRNTASLEQSPRIWRVGAYARLSREDGDKAESDSIANQRHMFKDYISNRPDLEFVELYADDGYSGTNFNRPDFQRMIDDIEDKRIDCILVKDLSRFGRTYLDMGIYLERWLPEHKVRFLAISENIDSEQGPYDILLPVKNIINEQYAKDISGKVKGALGAKRRRGEFIGSFASYGYQKDPQDHNRLIVDPCAATVVARIFDLYEQGMGKIKIAKLLNEEKVPAPSEYKRLNGERYHNGRRIQSTTYWTYATIHRMLQNQMYAGNMAQGRSVRPTMHGKAQQLDRKFWTVVSDTHEAIIGREQWERVQSLLQKDTRSMDFDQNVSPFAGFLRCGDCGRAMSKTNHPGGVYYCCGSYKRYGPAVCTRHGISQRELEAVLLNDLNQIIGAVDDLKDLAKQATADQQVKRSLQSDRERCQGSLERIYRLKKASYEDYKDGMISRQDYLSYKADYERQEAQLTAQLQQLQESEQGEDILDRPWVTNLLKHGRITDLDRTTLAETVKQIRIFEDNRIEITYNFSDDLGLLKEDVGNA